MNLSLAWIYDFLDASFESVNISFLIEMFNTHTAEIEGFKTHTLDIDSFDVGLCKKIVGNVVILELNNFAEIEILCLEEEPCLVNNFYLVKKVFAADGRYTFANLKDFGLDKEGYFPALYLSSEMFRSGAWKQFLPKNDIILEVDNKSITNRPDLWSHRGMAREFSLLLNVPFKSKQAFLGNIKTVVSSDLSSKFSDIYFQNQAAESCTAFSLTKLTGVNNLSSHPRIAFRLAMIGLRPYSCLVDLTNYVMYDWGSPTHAYDADTIEDNQVIVRNAKVGEKLVLLDKTELDLSAEDLVIASGSVPMGLAGIKGGYHHSLTAQTTNVLFEAAVFNPAVIRRASLRHKVRTDASARFEKTMDPDSIEDVVARFVRLAQDCDVKIDEISPCHLYKMSKEKVIIEIEHSFIEKKAGILFSLEQVRQVLEKLEFSVEVQNSAGDIVYFVTVPTFRATKNVLTPEDIVEEVIRCVGFENIPSTVAPIMRDAYDLSPILKLRSIKKYLAFGVNMQEQANYVFYDEVFLKKIGYDPGVTLNIVNPVSENGFRLVQSLIPNLLLNVYNNFHNSDSFRFFEVAKVWQEQDQSFLEKKVVSGVFISKLGMVDFYSCKKIVDDLANSCGSIAFSWQKNLAKKYCWEGKNHLATVMFDSKVIGVSGLLDNSILRSIGFEEKASGFFFELMVDPLLEEDSFAKKTFVPISKYQASYVDLSILVPLQVTVAEIILSLKDINNLVQKVVLLDTFEKSEWVGLRSLTFRLHLQSQDRSIEKDDLDSVHLQALNTLQAFPGIVVRT